MRVGVLGAGGRMGRVVCAAVTAAEDMELVCAVDPAFAGAAVAELSGVPGTELVIEAGAPALGRCGVDVAVDFTRPGVAMDNLRICAGAGIHAVAGTTGFTDADFEELEGLFGAAAGPNAVVCANFAIGAVLMMRFAEVAARVMDAAEIIELHHDAKLDAPSGTALATAEAMARGREAAGKGSWPADATEKVALAGARGGRGPGGAAVHSVRLPGLVAHQEVLFGAAGQSLTIRHDSYDRTSFMPGVLAALRAVERTPGLTRELGGILGIG